jgi:hypothetical protein
MRWIGVLIFTGACSMTTPFPSDDIASFDGGPTFDSTLPKDANGFDVAKEVGTPFNGGGPFTCGDCTCDGTRNYCAEISGGKAPILDSGVDSGTDAGADADGSSACDPEASACAPIPIGCLPKPTCDCVMKSYTAPCTCDVDPSGNGLVVSCVYP